MYVQSIDIDSEIEYTPVVQKSNKMRSFLNFVIEVYNHLYMIIIFEVIFYFNCITVIEKERITNILEKFAKHINKIIVEYKQFELNTLIIDDMCKNLDTKYINIQNHEIEIIGYNLIYITSIIFVVCNMLHILFYKDIFYIFKIVLKTLANMFLIFVFEICFFYNIVLKYVVITNDEASCLLLNNIKV